MASINHSKLVGWLLRIALALVFLYAAIGSTLAPSEWIGYLPGFLTNYVNPTIILKFFSLYELLLALLLLGGIYVRYVALLAAATLVGIVASNFSLFIITFRDFALMFAALALAALPPEDSSSLDLK